MKFDLKIKTEDLFQSILNGQNAGTFELAIGQMIKGDSAYELAVQDGFGGTTAEWLQSLVQPAEDAQEDANALMIEFQENETERIRLEGLRISAETNRNSAETLRLSKEIERIDAEILRVENELERIRLEGLRISAETIRKTNEIDRIATINGLTDTFDTKVDKTSIKQALGDSETDIMSQKAVTDELSTIEADIITNTNDIRTLENTLNSANINQETTATVTGVDIVSLPKTAANTGMQVQLFGQSAENLVVNGDFRNGNTGWTSNPVYTISSNKAIFTDTADTSYLSQATLFPNNSTDVFYTAVRVIDYESGMAFFTQYYNTDVSSHRTLSQNGVLSIVSRHRGSSTYQFYLDLISFSGSISNIIAINLTQAFGAGNEPTKEQCDILFANYFEGTDNVLGTGRVRSDLNRNLLPKTNTKNWGLWDSGIITYGTDGNLVTIRCDYRTNWCVISLPYYTMKLQQGINYTLSFYAKGTKQLDYNYIINVGSTGNNTLTNFIYASPINTTNFVKVTCSFVGTSEMSLASGSSIILGIKVAATVGDWMEIKGVKIETGISASNWTPALEDVQQGLYPATGTSLYLTAPILRSNGLVKDEIRKGTNGYELVKRISDTVILNGSEDWLNGSTLLTNTISFRLAIAGIKHLGVNRSSFWANVTGGISANDAEVMQAIEGILYVRINQSRLSTLDVPGFKLWLTANNQTLNYELDTPNITPIPHAGLLNSNSNGTVYFEPIIADAGVYSTNLAIQLTDYPIASFESIRKYANGTYTELSTATAIIAVDGLSFTHPDLVNGDLVMFTYAYNKESIGRSMTLTHYDSRFVEADTANGKVYRIVPVITNGAVSWTTVEV